MATCFRFSAFKITLPVNPLISMNTELKRLFRVKIRHFSACFFLLYAFYLTFHSKGLSCNVESWSRIEVPNGVQRFSSYLNLKHGGTFRISNNYLTLARSVLVLFTVKWLKVKPQRKSLKIFVNGKLQDGRRYIWQEGSRVIGVQLQWDTRYTTQVINKDMSPKSEPWGTPVIIDMKLEHTPVTLTHFWRPSR